MKVTETDALTVPDTVPVLLNVGIPENESITAESDGDAVVQ